MAKTTPKGIQSGIRDNYHRGTVGDFLKQKIKDGSHLSVVSAYFTIYAFEALKYLIAKPDHNRAQKITARILGLKKISGRRWSEIQGLNLNL